MLWLLLQPQLYFYEAALLILPRSPLKIFQVPGMNIH
jgi:hypothetical protein